eukprot:365371-Chlamydomonas_euryale.AAC.2
MLPDRWVNNLNAFKAACEEVYIAGVGGWAAGQHLQPGASLQISSLVAPIDRHCFALPALVSTITLVALNGGWPPC